MIRTTQINLAPGMVNLGIGQPDFALLPLDIVQQAAAHRLSQGDPYLLNYGYEQGDGYCRRALAEFLTVHYGRSVSPDHLILSAGASQGLDLICTLFGRPGDTIFVEEPSYFLALRIFTDHGFNVVSLPTDAQGLVVDALEEALTLHDPAFLYLIPTFQNPAGVTLTLERRARLVELSQEYDLLIVADEVYHLLNYSGVPPAPLALHTEQANILSLGSFSKILAPGLRLGWVQGAPALIEKLTLSGLVDSGGGLNHFTSALVRSVLELDLLDPYLAQLKSIYHLRATTLAEALRRRLPEADFAEAAGGFFLWLRLPPVLDTEALLEEAQRQQVGFVPGIRFSSRGGLRNYLRLSFSFHDIPAMQQGVDRLRTALDATLAKAR